MTYFVSGGMQNLNSINHSSAMKWPQTHHGRWCTGIECVTTRTNWKMDINAPASTWMSLSPRWPAVTLNFDLQNTIKVISTNQLILPLRFIEIAQAVHYILWNKICPDERKWQMDCLKK